MGVFRIRSIPNRYVSFTSPYNGVEKEVEHLPRWEPGIPEQISWVSKKLYGHFEVQERAFAFRR
jgi:hypothetical protein